MIMIPKAHDILASDATRSFSGVKGTLPITHGAHIIPQFNNVSTTELEAWVVL